MCWKYLITVKIINIKLFENIFALSTHIYTSPWIVIKIYVVLLCCGGSVLMAVCWWQCGDCSVDGDVVTVVWWSDAVVVYCGVVMAVWWQWCGDSGVVVWRCCGGILWCGVAEVWWWWCGDGGVLMVTWWRWCGSVVCWWCGMVVVCCGRYTIKYVPRNKS